MIITADTLARFNACNTQKAIFAIEFPNGLDVSGLWGDSATRAVTWKQLLSIDIVKRNVGWAIARGVLPSRIVGCFRGADLSYADLRGANLSDADLSGADLRSAGLRSADLSYADLRDADLSGADLSGADLGRANLSGADLSNADLSGVTGYETR